VLLPFLLFRPRPPSPATVMPDTAVSPSYRSSFLSSATYASRRRSVRHLHRLALRQPTPQYFKCARAVASILAFLLRTVRKFLRK
jgi:hypothetical protein